MFVVFIFWGFNNAALSESVFSEKTNCSLNDRLDVNHSVD